MLRYLKPRYFLFLLKFILYKLRFNRRFRTNGFWYGFEKDVTIRLDSAGVLELGRMVYLSKRTDLISLGGTIKIGDNVFINKDCTIVARASITIGSDCCLGEGVSIYDHDHTFADSNAPIASQGFTCRPVSLGNNVWVGGKVFIKSGVAIGNNVIIGANSAVTKDIPDGMIAYGNPARYRPLPAAKKNMAVS